MQEPGYYIHIEPGKSFIAGGIYMPDKDNLAKVRQEIDYNGEKLIRIMNNKAFKKLFNGLDEIDKLKTTPKGYDVNHPHIEFLKHKSLIVSHSFTDTQVSDKKFLKSAAAVAKTIKPFNDFIREAIS